VDERPACLPTFTENYTTNQFEALIESFLAFGPEVFGACEAACWVQQVSIMASPACVVVYQALSGTASWHCRVHINP
jgi:hypothetical protein